MITESMKNTVAIPCIAEEGMEPFYATADSAGADLKAHIEDEIVLNPLQRVLVPTGVRIAIPSGFEGQVRPRSGLAVKKGISIVNSPGTIDADYRGEIKVILVNLSNDTVSIAPNERIAQLVICPVLPAEFTLVDTLPDTERGSGGFGSTGA